MKKNKYRVNPRSLYIASLVILLMAVSCQQDEKVISPSNDTSLETYFQFLEEASGVGREDILYDPVHEQFTVAKDMIVSRSSITKFLTEGSVGSMANGRTEQRRNDLLLNDANATNFKYYIQPAVTAAWQDAARQAIYQWNNVGGSKLHLVEVSSQSAANINLFIGAYDAANWVARATLPTTNGTGTLEINPRFNDMESGQKLFTIVHEMGHNIGFWHTDQTIGTLIPGTPDTDPNSVMNSYVLPWNGYTNYDLIAVRYLYPGTFSTTIQAENYSAMSNVQTEACSDDSGGLNVGYIDATDWMAYNSITIPSTGTYRVEYRVASLAGGGRLSIDLNAGSIVLGMLDVPATGGWQSWTTVSHNVTISAGTYNVGIYAQAGGWNLNWFRITKL